MAKAIKDKETQANNGLKRLRQRLTQVSKYPSFPAYLRQDFDAFSDAISLGGPTKWDEIAKWAMEEGYTGGKPIQAATAKRSYERVKQRRQFTAKSAKPARSQTITTPTPRVAEARLNTPDKAKGLSSVETDVQTNKPQTIDDIRAMMGKTGRKVPKPIL